MLGYALSIEKYSVLPNSTASWRVSVIYTSKGGMKNVGVRVMHGKIRYITLHNNKSLHHARQCNSVSPCFRLKIPFLMNANLCFTPSRRLLEVS
jgi:hypothetical protein